MSRRRGRPLVPARFSAEIHLRTSFLNGSRRERPATAVTVYVVTMRWFNWALTFLLSSTSFACGPGPDVETSATTVVGSTTGDASETDASSSGATSGMTQETGSTTEATTDATTEGTTTGEPSSTDETTEETTDDSSTTVEPTTTTTTTQEPNPCDSTCGHIEECVIIETETDDGCETDEVCHHTPDPMCHCDAWYCK